LITTQVKKNEPVYEEMFPFRKGWDMVEPDSEYCKECKGACCGGGVTLYPRDFERGKEVVSIIKLLKMELVELYIDGYNDFIHVYITNNDHAYTCIFKCVWGCIIPADMRPVICRFYGPVFKQTGRYKYCIGIQDYLSYGNRNWQPFKEELLKEGVLECSNVHAWRTK